MMVDQSEGTPALLELDDGTVYHGYNFGADRSVAGELVFQTGMVGYPESVTDPSYRGQILVMTFPLAGNYGVPPRDQADRWLKDLPAYFESSRIHIAGLVVASYCGENYSHHLSTSSLGQWLKEQDVPAICGLDTRALTKQIRVQGSMLGRLLIENPKQPNGVQTNGTHDAVVATSGRPELDAKWRQNYPQLPFTDPNLINLVAEGDSPIHGPFCCSTVQV